MPIASSSGQTRGGAAIDRGSWIGQRNTSAAVHADRNTSGAFTTRIPGRSKFRNRGLKCSGLKQKMNSRGRRPGGQGPASNGLGQAGLVGLRGEARPEEDELPGF